MLRRRRTSIPFGFPPRSSVARGTWSGTRARLIPSTSPTCFVALLVFLVISSTLALQLVTKNQGDPVVECQLTVFDEHDLSALSKHRRDRLVHRVVHDVRRRRIVDVQVQVSPLIDARRLVISLLDHEDLPAAEPGQVPHFAERGCRPTLAHRSFELLE